MCLPHSSQTPGKGSCWSRRGHLPGAGPACSVWAAELGSLCLDHTRSAFQEAAVFCPTPTSHGRSSWVAVGTSPGLGPPAPLWLTSTWGILGKLGSRGSSSKACGTTCLVGRGGPHPGGPLGCLEGTSSHTHDSIPGRVAAVALLIQSFHFCL